MTILNFLAGSIGMVIACSVIGAVVMIAGAVL